MAANSKVIALLSTCLCLGVTGVVATSAIERGPTSVAASDAEQLCPPGSCSIVVKTSVGGPPSVVHTVPAPAPAVTPASAGRPAVRPASAPVLVADVRSAQ